MNDKVKKERAPKVPKEKKERVRMVAGHHFSTRYQMGVDEDGKSYSSANNPKRAGSKAAEWFTAYRNNGTIQAVIDAGVPAGDVKWNLEKGFIKIAA